MDDHKKNKLKQLFKQTKCLSLDQLYSYSQDKLPPEAKFEIEHHLLDCDLCSDALEGMKELPSKKQIHKRLKWIKRHLSSTIKTDNKISNTKWYTAFAFV